MRSNSRIRDGLNRLLKESSQIKINNNSRIIILSDFHLGNRKSRDDFLKNSQMCMYILEEYFRQGYTLILNGDIEELYRIAFPKVKKKWDDLYELFIELGFRAFIWGKNDYRLCLAGFENSKKFLHFVGSSNKKHLKRMSLL